MGVYLFCHKRARIVGLDKFAGFNLSGAERGFLVIQGLSRARIGVYVETGVLLRTDRIVNFTQVDRSC